MDKNFTYEKKKKLAERISKLKKKEDLVKIFEIIHDENKNITENNNGLFLFFHNLSDKTYQEITLYLNKLYKKKSNELFESDNMSEKKEYKPYFNNDFPDQEKLSPKLKYSNREKNIIKRQRYDETINSETTNDEKIDVSSSTTSEKNINEEEHKKNNFNDLFKEPAKESLKEPAKESLKEPAKESLKEPAKESLKEQAKEIPKETTKNSPKDTLNESSKKKEPIKQKRKGRT